MPYIEILDVWDVNDRVYFKIKVGDKIYNRLDSDHMMIIICEAIAKHPIPNISTDFADLANLERERRWTLQEYELQ